MKGVILAGGLGSRLRPLTSVTNKHLLPVYDKPMIYYPICTLMLAGVTDFLIITTPQDKDAYRRLLGDGSDWGVKFSYKEQESPDGLAQAFILGEDFVGNDSCALILGDNIFHGHGIAKTLRNAAARDSGATVFGYPVGDPERFGVVEIDADGRPVSIEEKPQNAKSNLALPGLYFFDSQVVEHAKKVTPSDRGELEITDVLRSYMKDQQLHVEHLGRGIMWIDCGTHESLINASEYIVSIERNQNLKVCCPEEIAFFLGLIDVEQLKRLAECALATPYNRYLLKLAERGKVVHAPPREESS